MSFDWQDYLRVANSLANKADVDADQADANRRTAISRSYYAVHCLARNKALAETSFSKTGDAHIEVIEYFQDLERRGTKGAANIATWLDRLKKNRRMADYEDEFAGLAKQVNLCLRIAADAVNQIKALP